MEKTINYDGQEHVVSEEVADFLEQDRRRQEAEDRSCRRHECLAELEFLLAAVPQSTFYDPVFEEVRRNLENETLRSVLAQLPRTDLELIILRFYEEWTVQQIADHFSVSKAAISKKQKNILLRLRELMN